MIGRVITITHELKICGIIVCLVEVLMMNDRSLARKPRDRSKNPTSCERPMETLVALGIGLENLCIAFGVCSPI